MEDQGFNRVLLAVATVISWGGIAVLLLTSLFWVAVAMILGGSALFMWLGLRFRSHARHRRNLETIGQSPVPPA